MTPRVREEVRKHYGCDKLSGAELEDQGEEGTALTHWEKRLFEVNFKCKYTENLKANEYIFDNIRVFKFYINIYILYLFIKERSNDGNSYTKSYIFEDNDGINGRYWMVYAELWTSR